MFHKRLMKEFSHNRNMIFGMVAAQWGMLLANIVLMLAAAGFIEAMADGESMDGWIGRIFATLVITAGLRGVFSYINGRLSFVTSSQVKEQLRKWNYEKLMRLGNHYRETLPTSEAVQISTEGVEQLEIYFGKYVPQFFYSMLAPVTLFFVVGMMSMKAAVILLFCVPLIPVSIVAVQKFARKMLDKYWGTYVELGDSFLECLQGLTTLKIYEADGRYAARMDEEAERFRFVTMRVLIMQLNSISIMDLAAYGGAAAGMVISVLEFQSGRISLAECFFIIMISAEFFLPLRLLGSFFHIAMNGNAAADKMFRLLDAEEEEAGAVLELKHSELECQNVSFCYEPGQAVVEDICLRAGKGLTALAGKSGCGKTTMTELLLGTLAPDQGTIEFGGVLLSDINPDIIYKKMTRIRHDSYLFSGTVRENLKMGKEAADDEEMEEALRKVNLLSFVRENGGLDMALTEKAANLSGGQKQRLAIARALLHNSDLYIFDEATSNVDVESEEDIMRVVRELAKEKTVIIISHRLANVRDADRIYMFHDKRTAEIGTHKELMDKRGRYWDLYSSQMELEQYGRRETGNEASA